MKKNWLNISSRSNNNNYSILNRNPMNVDRLYQDILDNIVNEDFIKLLYPRENLSHLTDIKLQIDTSLQSVFELHHILPRLQSLILDNSRISTIRDLGVGLRFISKLSLVQCCIYDLDGIGVLSGIEELNIDDNFVSDLYPLAMHDNLTVSRRQYMKTIRNVNCL